MTNRLKNIRTDQQVPWSYRQDPAVPDFPDDNPLIIFDGVCILCSGFVQFVLKRDKQNQFRFATAQSALGQALYRHYGLDTQNFETNLLLEDGLVYGKLQAFRLIVSRFGGIYRLVNLSALLPQSIQDWLYDRIALNRYTLFGQTDVCITPSKDWQDRCLNPAPTDRSF